MNEPPKLPDRVRDTPRIRHYRLRTEDAYLDWFQRFILSHKKQSSGAPQSRLPPMSISEPGSKRWLGSRLVQVLRQQVLAHRLADIGQRHQGGQTGDQLTVVAGPGVAGQSIERRRLQAACDCRPRPLRSHQRADPGVRLAPAGARCGGRSGSRDRRGGGPRVPVAADRDGWRRPG